SAVFLKGPIGPGLALTTAVTLSVADREVDWLRGLRPVSGLIVTALAVAPWLYAIEHATEGQFLQQSVGRDFFSKILGAQEAHGAPPLYYLALAFLTFWPGSLFLVPAVIGGWRRRALPAVRFLLAWLLPAWIGLELVPTKLPHYALPLYPALALLAAMAIIENSPPRWARIASMLLWSVATLAITAGLVVLPIRLGSGVSAIGVVSAIALLVLAAVLLLRCHEPWRITALLAAMSVALVISVASFVVPDLDRLWLSRAIATMIAAHPPAPGGLVVIGYNEPSLVFLLNGNFKTGVADALVAAGDEALVMTRMAGDFERILASRGLSGERIDSVSGTDYSNGQQMTLTLYKIEPK
ncbi:MAG TPA: glycosyltransferase family 39 protein, partial [Stellaceae bacterium]|nr:glycosyltransferase family 39 protein [Stellaceae bacterium]